MTVSRAMAFGAIVVAAVIIAIVLLTGSGGHHYTLLFQNAGQLVKDDDVQVGGVRVGSVRSIGLTSNNLAKIEIEVQNGFQLHQGTTASVRQKSLSGIANRAIVLQMGPNSAPVIPDGQTLPLTDTTSPVDLDQLFNTLNPRTRQGLQDLIVGSATAIRGKGPQANQAAHYFNPFVSTTARLVTEITHDQAALNSFIVNGARVTRALGQRAPTITALVSNANATAAAIGSEDAALNRDLELAPPTLRRANTTFVNLRNTLDDVTKLVNVSKPVAPRLAPFFKALRPLIHDAVPTIHDLRLLIRRPGNENDLIELLRKTPQLQREAKPTFAHTIAALQQSTPVLSFIRPYTPDLTQWFRDFGAGASTYDANGHYARIQPIFNTFQFNDSTNTLTPLANGLSPLTGLSTGNNKRCPGTATQVATDHSNDWRDSDGSLDCNPNQVLPGP